MNLTIPTHMQAVQLDPGSSTLSVCTLPVPKPGPGQVLVKMAASPINPSDLNFIQGQEGSGNQKPIVPGFEGSGTVVAAGPGLLPRLWLGKRVTCAASPGLGGAWAEYMLTSAMQSFPLRKSLSLEQGATLIVNPMTALAFFHIARQGHHRAIVNNAAASALGQMILRLGLKRRIPVIHIVRRKEQVDLLLSLGASYVLDSSQPGFVSELRALAHDLKATLFLDAIAGDQTQQYLEAAPDGSTVLLYAKLAGDPRFSNASALLNKRIEGFYLPNWISKRNPLQILFDLRSVQQMADSELNTKIHARLPLSEVQTAVDTYQKNMSSGKVLLVMDPRENL